MLRRNRIFIALGLLYGLIGGLLGIVWLAVPEYLGPGVPRLHGHLMLLGFVAMTIYGVGLHVLPRFSGHVLFSERLADGQFVFANIGLWVMSYGWLIFNEAVILVGGALAWAGIVAFAVNVMLTVRLTGPRG
jgi:hypothetical protein